MDGRSARPSGSGMTRGTPPSTWATRLLVVPRSMPTMRDMALQILPEGFAQVIDDGAQVGPRGQARLEPLEQGPAIGARAQGGVPIGGSAHDGLLLLALPLLQALPLRPEPGARLLVHPRRLGLLERLLHLQHLGQELPGSGGPRRRALAGVPALFQRDQILHARERVPERPVGAIDQGGSSQRLRLDVGVRSLVEVRVMRAAQVVEARAERLTVHDELARQPEHREIVVDRHHLTPLSKYERARPRPAIVDPGARPRPRTRSHSRSWISPAGSRR